MVTVLENRRLELHTTRSWEFLGLEKNGVAPTDSLWNISGYGDGVIIGTLDTGWFYVVLYLLLSLRSKFR